MRIAAIQMDMAWEQVDANLERAARLLGQAAAGGAQFAALPEMFATGFSMNTEQLAQPQDGPIERFMAAQAKQHGLHVLGSVAVQGETLPRNEALLYGPSGELLLRQPKLHPFGLAGEQHKIERGRALEVVPAGGFGVGAAVCYDLRFPEQFRALAFRGATLIVVPANWPTPRVTAWSHLLVSRAVENLCYVVGVNRVGTGGDLDYDGCSAIIDPMGEVLATDQGDETVLVADITPERVAEVRHQLPFLADARQDLFPRLWD
jgi:predicted amidohydrolase